MLAVPKASKVAHENGLNSQMYRRDVGAGAGANQSVGAAAQSKQPVEEYAIVVLQEAPTALLIVVNHAEAEDAQIQGGLRRVRVVQDDGCYLELAKADGIP
eukprot:6199669-Pleurochrysis_carterae.AAC.4